MRECSHCKKEMINDGKQCYCFYCDNLIHGKCKEGYQASKKYKGYCKVIKK